MRREFDRNLFIMLFAIMVGAIIITYFAADIVKKSEMESLSQEITSELNTKHSEEIKDINSLYENFTDNFLQGFTKINSARETRSYGDYYFDFALFWYNNVISENNESYVEKCIDSCVNASYKYISSKQKFSESRPYFTISKNFTNDSSYIGLADYFISFTKSGEEITDLRYKTSICLKKAVENYSAGDFKNSSEFMENFTMLENMYEDALKEYTELEDLIDNFVFFEEDRTKPGGSS